MHSGSLHVRFIVVLSYFPVLRHSLCLCFFLLCVPGVLVGEMRVLIQKPDGKVEEVARMSAGKYFGEIALVRDAPRTATVVSSKRSVLLMISKENFVRFFARVPEAIADFEVKLARADCHLKSVLYHPIVRLAGQDRLEIRG